MPGLSVNSNMRTFDIFGCFSIAELSFFVRVGLLSFNTSFVNYHIRFDRWCSQDRTAITDMG